MGKGALAAKPRLVMRIEGASYDLTDFDHPGGLRLIELGADKDMTTAFAANHLRPAAALHKLRQYRLPAGAAATDHADDDDAQNGSGSGDAATSGGAGGSKLHQELKQRVLKVAGPRPWSLGPSYALWAATFVAAYCVDASAGLGWRVLKLALLFLRAAIEARQVWTHMHQAVHTPNRIRPWQWWAINYVNGGMLAPWTREHQYHHRDANNSDAGSDHTDSDVFMFEPFISFRNGNDGEAEGGASGASGASGAKATATARAKANNPLVYALCLLTILPFMTFHTLRQATCAEVVFAAFALVSKLLAVKACFAPPGWAQAISFFAINAYVSGCFVVTHIADEGNFARTDDHFLNTLHATNNYTLEARVFGTNVMDFAAGGINYHIEHHLFPSINYADLHKVAPVVQAFCAEHGLPYHTYRYPDLVRTHMRTVLKEPHAKAA